MPESDQTTGGNVCDIFLWLGSLHCVFMGPKKGSFNKSPVRAPAHLRATRRAVDAFDDHVAMKNIDDPPASTPRPDRAISARLANDTSPPSDEKRRAERRRCFSNLRDEPALPPASVEERDADTSVARVFVPTLPEGVARRTSLKGFPTTGLRFPTRRRRTSLQ